MAFRLQHFRGHLPANHDRGTVEDWRPIAINGEDNFGSSDEALSLMRELDHPGAYRVVSEMGAVYGSRVVSNQKAA